MKIVTENSTGQFITNCMRQHFDAKFNTVYYKLRRYLYMIYFKVLKHISNHFNFQLQTINKLDKLYTKTDMYIYYFRIPHNTPSLFVLKFCISSCFQKLFRKYSVLPIVCTERGQTVYYGELKSQHLLHLCYRIFIGPNFFSVTGSKSSSFKAESGITCNPTFYPKYLNDHEEG